MSLCTSVALGREFQSICLQDGQFVYKTGRGPTTNILVYLCGVRARNSVNLFTRGALFLQDGEGSNQITITWRFPEGVLKEEIQL